MKKILLTTIAILAATAIYAQLDLKLIKETVENEKQYFNDILGTYLNDDPCLRTEDIALVYYGQAYLPEYRAGNDSNEEKLKSYAAEGDYDRMYSTAKKILEYNPVSLNALFYGWLSSDRLGKETSEVDSYVHKYIGILNMITSYGDGKSTANPFRVICPDDQDHILYGIMDIEDVKARNLDTESLCNVINVTPSNKFPSRTMYIDASIYLSHVASKKK